MKKVLFALCIFLGTVSIIKAQNNYVPTKVGMSLLYKMYDSNGKPDKIDDQENWLKYTIQNKEIKGDTTIIQVQVDGAIFQSKESEESGMLEELQHATYKIYGDKVSLDMQFLSRMMNKVFEKFSTGQQQFKVEVTSNPSVMPSNLKPGISLPDFTCMKQKITMEAGGLNFSINMNVQMKNRKIESQESITTPAGTFNCMKYTYDCFTTIEMQGGMGNQEFTMKFIEWLDPELGMVKTEHYSQKGKMDNQTILEKIEK